MDAVRISVPMTVPMILSLFIFENATVGSVVGFSDLFTKIAVWGLIFAIGTLWTAVSWHRYVLLEEVPSGLVPTFHLQIWPYFWRGVLIALVLGLAMLFAAFVTSAIASAVGVPLLAVASTLILTLLMSWTFYLLSPILPAAALGQKMSFAQAWEHSEDFAGAIFALTISHLVFVGVLNFVLGMIAGQLGPIGVFLSVVVNWFSIMLGISVLTSIYGVVVEERTL